MAINILGESVRVQVEGSPGDEILILHQPGAEKDCFQKNFANSNICITFAIESI